MIQKNIYVGSADGTSADDGTSIEYGIAIICTENAVIYRTDFRTAMEKELGLNAMFTIDGTVIIYEPCFFTDLSEVDAYYEKLAMLIDQAIKSITSKNS